MTEAPAVIAERVGNVGYLILDKPRALNALDLNMVRELHRGLHQHLHDRNVACIVLRSSSDRAFCAGGDMKHMRELVLGEEEEEIHSFFTEEYALNLAIAQCRKPYIAILDGIAMGGGLGISVHGRFRIVTERARLAMPEARIGLFPDVGGTYFLPRLPARVGWWLALCGVSVQGYEAVQCGLGTHPVDSGSVQALCTALQDEPNGDVEPVLASFSFSNEATSDRQSSAQAAEFSQVLRSRETWFSGNTAKEAQTAMTAAVDTSEDQNQVQDAGELLSQLESASPYSIQLIEHLFMKNAALGLEACLQNERLAIIEAIQHPDFAEGIRALLVNKDQSPLWQPSTR